MTTATITAPKPHTLTSAEADQFRRDGWLGPYTAVSPNEMAAIRDEIDREVLTTPGPNKGKVEHMRHLDCRVVYDLVAHPAIVGRIQALLGPHLLLWASNFWLKNPGEKEIPWHQDGSYWPLEPVINVTAWIAIDRVTVDNACLEIIPGSHKKVIPHIRAGEEHLFATMADPAAFDPTQRVQLEMEPGEFVLFNERTLHGSGPNHSNRRRLAIGPRYTIPIVRVEPTGPLWPGHASILVSGEDYMGLNRLVEPPKAGD